jgi:hypothetical protein
MDGMVMVACFGCLRRIEEQALRGDYSKVQPGDCVVAFSKADIFSIR